LQFFDFSRFEKLKFIRFQNLGPASEGRVDKFDVVLAAIKSLPEDLPSLTVSLFFSYGWGQDGEFIRQVDSLLANHNGVSSIEMVFWRSETRERMRGAFPQLLAKEKVYIPRQTSEAAQIFDT
jgi:hypothetical protein